MTELIWQDKYAENGKRTVPLTPRSRSKQRKPSTPCLNKDKFSFHRVRK